MPVITRAPIETIEADICVVGGGISGICAAISAARQGASVLLLQDRPVLGGNASSEIRMWICGAHGRYFKEAGILEEIQLLNYYRNPNLKYPIWDTVLYEMVEREVNIQLYLSCSVCDVSASSGRITGLRAWHLTRHTWIDVKATNFIDCSGDSILRFSGAGYRWGREDSLVHGEPHGKEMADRKTMGSSILLQLREIDPNDHIPFNPPSFARKLDDDHPHSARFWPTGNNFWWIEIGGEMDTIKDADSIRDELYSIAYGVWDYIKNHTDGRGHKWELEWIGSLPGKRENVRYVGDYTLTQQDIESRGQFYDIIAYGGWTMDDHAPAAFDNNGPSTIFHAAPSPYGIPFGVLCSADVDNLMFAGRNISATHMALSSTRVMATCSMLGQAAGAACAMSVNKCIKPSDIKMHIHELQNRLMDDDQWLPCFTREQPTLTRDAKLDGSGIRSGNLVNLTDGIERALKDAEHSVKVDQGGYLELSWPSEVDLYRIRIVVQTNLHDQKRLPCSFPKKSKNAKMPKTMPRDLDIEVLQGGKWVLAKSIKDNCQRCIKLPLEIAGSKLRLKLLTTWGGVAGEFFSLEVGEPNYSESPKNTSWPEAHWTGEHRNHA